MSPGSTSPFAVPAYAQMFEAIKKGDGVTALTNAQLLKSQPVLTAVVLPVPPTGYEYCISEIHFSVDREVDLQLLDASGGSEVWIEKAFPLSPPRFFHPTSPRRIGLGKTLFVTSSGGAAAGVFAGWVRVRGLLLCTNPFGLL